MTQLRAGTLGELVKFASFFDGVADRLRTGAREYGNQSHSLSIEELFGEIQAKLHDVAGWSAILSEKLSRLTAAPEILDAMLDVVHAARARCSEPMGRETWQKLTRACEKLDVVLERHDAETMI